MGRDSKERSCPHGNTDVGSRAVFGPVEPVNRHHVAPAERWNACGDEIRQDVYKASCVDFSPLPE